MYISAHVLFGVIHELMDVLFVEAGIGRQFISEQFRTARDIDLYMLLQSLSFSVRYVLDTDLTSLAIQQADNQFLAYTAGPFNLLCFLILVHEAREATDHGFVSFDWARTAHLLKAAALHSFADAMKHEPCGLLGNVQIARHFVAANSILAINDQPHSYQPLVERKRTIFEDRADLDRELALGVIVLTLPQTAGFQKARFFTTAVWTNDATRPTHRCEELKRSIW